MARRGGRGRGGQSPRRPQGTDELGQPRPPVLRREEHADQMPGQPGPQKHCTERAQERPAGGGPRCEPGIGAHLPQEDRHLHLGLGQRPQEQAAAQRMAQGGGRIQKDPSRGFRDKAWPPQRIRGWDPEEAG